MGDYKNNIIEISKSKCTHGMIHIIPSPLIITI